MNIVLDKKSATEGSIRVSLKEEDYQSLVDKKIKEHSKKAQIKGFRQGKVPISYIQKMYGKSILVEEINTLLSKSLTDYIKENKLNILGDPLPDLEKAQAIDWDNEKDFDFDYKIGMVDDFKVDLAAKMTKYEITVDDKAVQKTIGDLKKQFGTMTNPEKSENGDSLFGTLTQVDGDFVQDMLLETDDLEKKEKKNFIGISKEASVKFDLLKAIKDIHKLSHALSKSEEETKALEGAFEFTVKNVNRKVDAEINQEFFDRVFGKDAVTDEKTFTEKVKTTISENYVRESDMFLDHSVRKQFVENTKMNLPDEFLKDWLFVSNEGKITKEVIDKEYEMYATDLKWTIIQNKISEDNEIKAEHEDVIATAKTMIRAQLQQSGMAGQMEDSLDMFVDNYLKGENGNNYMKVFEQSRNEKVLAFVKEKIKVSTKKVDMEKFKDIVSK